MGNDSTTDVTSVEVTAETLDLFDKCLEQLFVQALQTGSQILLATHKELIVVRQLLSPSEE
jgi:hypothetical protein